MQQVHQCMGQGFEPCRRSLPRGTFSSLVLTVLIQPHATAPVPTLSSATGSCIVSGQMQVRDPPSRASIRLVRLVSIFSGCIDHSRMHGVGSNRAPIQRSNLRRLISAPPMKVYLFPGTSGEHNAEPAHAGDSHSGL